MDISKKPYEISIWEDKASIHPTTNKRFFEESLIATIGSDTMDTPIRAFNPLFNLNINGTSTLTFQIFSTYYDEEKDEEVENPFLKLLVNERKLKLRYDNGNRKWFDFIIKDVQEDSTTNTFSYTAYDLHIEELSKTGFEIELNPELENNQGTVVELGERVLKGSDWKVRPDVSDIFRQTIKEPLYEIVLSQNITAYNMIDNQLTPITITSGETIYGFYSSIMEKNPYFQFLYHATNGYEVDDDRIVLNAPSGSNYYINNVTYRDGTYNPVPSFSTSNAPPIAELYRGERLVRQQSIVYDPKIEKYVNVYKSGGTTIYGLEETEYIGATITKNFISNSEEFVTTHGWIPSTNTTIKDIIYPPITPTLNIQATNFTPYLQFKFTNSNAMLMNTGIQDNRAYINNIAKGEKYVLRFKYKMGATPSITPTGDKRLIGSVGAYTLDSNGNYQITKTYITFSPANTVVDVDTGFSYIIGTASNALSLSEMVNSRIGFFLRPGATSVGETYWLENLELFKYNTGNNGKMVVPGVPPEGIIKTIYSYYDPSSTYESLEDIQFIYRGDTPSPSYAKSYDPNFAKVRSITAAESNRYNLLQTLAETFECWVKFEIEYDEATGKMLREADGRLKKWISFHHFIGQDNQVGFHYGINVNAISRQILSDQIVTKLIVKNNANQFAEDGFCSIARAPENPPKENFLFNFKYYIQQGLLSYAEVQNDLYSNFGSWIGYFAKLRTINQNRENLIKKYSLLSVEATKLESDYQTYTLVKNEANEQVLFLKAELHQYTGLSYESFLSGTAAAKLKLEDPKVKEIIKELETHSNVSKKYTPLSTIYKDNLEAINAELKDIIAQLEVDRASKDILDKEFYDKYSSFIKEGSWISEDYVDDNLYYLDAESVLYTSSSPQISYNINVLELSALEEYKAYNFNLGDKTYIEHTEFFGWVFGPNGEKTPYREEIVVSQVSYSLDDPSQNQITVQNYKNQFEELFQRITATVQAVQYQTGALARVAGIVETDGTIKTNTLQNSLAYNQFLISNAADQSVQWDQSGITITNLRKPNEVLRLVSGGILLTTDGGLSWNYGMTGAGMNADFITAGQIDASRINIVGGAFSAFRWDHTGLNAYGLTRDETGTPLWFNFNEFVRFDQFGVYGFHGEDSFIPLTEGDIWADPGTKFALTWKGFLLRSGKEDGGYLLLDSERDFVVVDRDETERVRIGNLNPPQLTPRYGIQLKNFNNEVVLESSDTGSLFLRELLSIGPNSYAPRTQLGVISTDEDDVSKIFAINDKHNEEQLAMFDDGRLVAKNGEFHGGIFADYGKIGNMTIAQYEQSLEKFLVRANTEIFRVIPAQGATPEEVNPTSIDIEVDYENIGSVNESAIIWSYSTDFETWTSLGLTGKKITLSYTDHKAKFDATGSIIIRASYNSRFSFINLSRVMDGTIGQDGVGIESTSIRYQAGTSGTIAPEGMWLTTIPDVEANEYLWTRVIISYTDGDSTTSYSVGKMGAQGPQGIQGPQGSAGTSQYVHIRYSENSNGNPMTDTPEISTKYIGLANTTSPTAPAYSSFTWSLFQGPQGDQGIQGPDGTTTYTWVKYADTDTGSGMSDTPAGKKYIGLAFNKTDPTEIETASLYQWSLMPQNIKIGGRNLVLNSAEKNKPLGSTRITLIPTTDGLSEAGEYTISFNYEIITDNNASPISRFLLYSNGTVAYAPRVAGLLQGKSELTFTVQEARLNAGLFLYGGAGSSEGNLTNITFRNIKVEKGNVATDWTPAPEDVTAKINADVAAARTYAEIKATEAQDAAEAVAVAEAALAQTNAEAYADDIVSDEEQARIDQAAQNLADAKAHADTKAAEAENAAKGYADTQLGTFATAVNGTLDELQNQIDGSITTWFYNVPPTTSNVPASSWTTTELKNIHLGDLYYDTITGYAYRWQVVAGVYSWQRITDSDVTKALEDASKAQDTADSKRRVFTTTPTTPYEVGDLWAQGATGELMRCKTTALTGAYVASHWEKASKYTDDARAVAAENAAKAHAETKADEARVAAEAVAVAQAALAQTNSEAYADGIVDDEEAERIAQDTATLNAAKADASNKADAAEAAAKTYANTQLTNFATAIDGDISNLQTQVDGKITTWFYAAAPTTANVPANTWTTKAMKDAHLGDLYYNTSTGQAYRWKVVSTTYSWELITDNRITTALANASTAKDVADSKRRVFGSTPTAPYDVNDLWVQGTSGDIMRCITASTTTYSVAHWVKAVKYTDDTVANANLAAAIKKVESATYRIEDNTAVIIRYKDYADTSNPASTTYATQVSPQIYEARVYKEGIISPTTNYILDFQIYTRPNESAVELAWVSIEELKNPPYSFITPNTSTNVWKFNIEGLLDYNDTNASYLVKQTKNLLINGDFFRIVVKSLDGKIQTTRVIEVRNAVRDDLASFSILASKIAMAVHNTKLDFSLDGLNIYNGGLSIFKENEKVFYADEFGNLVLKGFIEAEGGYFNGELRAATGSFSGSVTIQEGSITGNLGVSGLLDLGGIKLDGGDGPGIHGIYSANYQEGDTGFLIAPNGEIFANQITLGSSASIQKYMRLGDAWIINPAAHTLFTQQERTDSLLESGDFIVVNKEDTRLLSIKDNGRIELGLPDSSLTIDAATASIFSGDYGIGTGWSITPTEATFNNIVARGSIRASVLEYAEVQAVAGIMIVRPSSIIKSAEKGTNNNVFVTLMNRNGFKSGDYCKLQITGSGLSTNVYKIALPSGTSPVLDPGNDSPEGDDGVKIELLGSSEISGVVDSLVGRPLIDFGVEGSIGIGINSSSNSSLIAPSSVSVFQTKINSEMISLDNKIVLGEIPNRPEFGNLSGTYGLYADNVLVKGSLIAQGETYYSGISSNLLYQSNDDVDANQLQTDSPILIWAGAEGATTENVINSVFKVYADGSFFAGKGFFKGSIITDAHITAAEIRTAVIKGWDRDPGLEDEGEAAALTIEDTDFGINFTDGNISKFKLETSLMTVNTKMELGSGYRFDSSSPFNTTRLFVYDSNTTSTIAITPSRIGFTQGRYQENITFNSFIDYNEGLNLYDSSGQETLMVKFKPTATRIYNNTELTQNLVLGDQMEFKQIRGGSNEVIGYDLFVREPN